MVSKLPFRPLLKLGLRFWKEILPTNKFSSSRSLEAGEEADIEAYSPSTCCMEADTAIIVAARLFGVILLCSGVRKIWIWLF